MDRISLKEDVFPGPKVELHVHLNGCFRHETLFELAKKKNRPISGCATLADLKMRCIVQEPKNLSHFLDAYELGYHYFAGDLEAIERLAYEFCEDSKCSNVIYSEVRYSPHRLVGVGFREKYDLQGLLDVTSQVIKGLKRGERDFGVRCKSILSGHSWLPELLSDLIKVCQNFRDDIVGIDLVSQEYSAEAPAVPLLVSLYGEAKRLGFGTTIHAGEASGPTAIQRAVEIYGTQRVGHGYHVVKDKTIYGKCLRDQVHFECCPWSSFLTGAVPFDIDTHPIKQFAMDGANFSINSDDTTITGYTLDGDYSLAHSWGLTQEQMKQTNLNAAKAAFLPEVEKKELIKQLMEAYKQS
nr:PREDICTED: adenosine deaminase-like [Bemisia tabaci]